MADERVQVLSENIITALPHELRTPLNTIIGFSDMLITESHRISKDQIADWGKHINLAGQRLYRLVENYLMYVRTLLIANNPEEIEILRKTSCEHPTTTVQVHTMLKAQQANREGDVEMELSEDVAVRISDHDLGKVVEELMDNAFKFSEPGTPVLVTTGVENDHYVLKVNNRGHGMSSEQIEAIGAYMQFSRWFYEQQGSGLGLAIAKRLTELYSGTLTIESVIDEAVTVIASLPLGTGSPSRG